MVWIVECAGILQSCFFVQGHLSPNALRDMLIKDSQIGFQLGQGGLFV